MILDTTRRPYRTLAPASHRPDARGIVAARVDERLLLAIAEAGLTDDGVIDRFHEQARRVLGRLGDALGSAIGAFEVRSDLDVGLTGTSVLHGDIICVTLGFGYTRDHCRIGYRTVRGRRDDCGGRVHHGAMHELLDLPGLAKRIVRDLGVSQLPAPVTPGVVDRAA